MASRALSPTSAPLDRELARHEAVIERAVETFGLPLHVVFKDKVERSANGYREVLRRLYPNSSILFAVKSNPCRGAVRTAARLGLGADAASEHELRAALEEGIPAERIVANGNAKTSQYVEAIVSSGALSSVDNADELEELSRAATSRHVRTPILIRFRGMPLSGFTADDQTTAAAWTKFGFSIDEAGEVFARVAGAPGLRFVGISAHVGTQIADPVAYELLTVHMVALARRAVASGLALSAIDLGGGYPVSFVTEAEWAGFQAQLLDRLRAPVRPGASVTWTDLPMGYGGAEPEADSPTWVGKAYWSAHPASAMLERALAFGHPDGKSTVQHLADLGSPTLIVEPGRSLMATSGVTLAEVRGTKSVLGNLVVSLDLGITNHGTNLITNDIFPVAILPRKADDVPVDAFLAGRLCFSGDMISKVKVRLNRAPRVGERAVVYLTGAYSADHFASNSCGFPLPAKVAVDGAGRLDVWRRPQRFEDVFGPVGEA
ncbi:MAG: alanine racemase [Candidatus Bipolaricaulis sp.]|nr:alanine racemase [Candidatus Bipolaricaulis sp.]